VGTAWLKENDFIARKVESAPQWMPQLRDKQDIRALRLTAEFVPAPCAVHFSFSFQIWANETNQNNFANIFILRGSKNVQISLPASP
jgi:hypothetical protein